MGNESNPLITLGSASPRRAALLDSIGVAFTVETVELDEQALVEHGEPDPRRSVEQIARAKFAAFAPTARSARLLTADTLVSCGREIMGKPGSDDELTSMLNAMSGRDITVATAVCSGQRGGDPSVEIVTTTVRLRTLSVNEISDYVATGTGMDKAGGLALQAEAGSFIDRLDGCWSNVLGLPLCAVTLLLEEESVVGETAGARCSAALCGTHQG